MSSQAVPIVFTVTPLTDNSIWFANAAAWSNYWAGNTATATISSATTVTAGVVNQAATSAFAPPGTFASQYWVSEQDLLGNGVFTQVSVPLAVSFDQTKARLESMITDYQNLKSALVAAGIITTA